MNIYSYFWLCFLGTFVPLASMEREANEPSVAQLRALQGSHAHRWCPIDKMRHIAQFKAAIKSDRELCLPQKAPEEPFNQKKSLDTVKLSLKKFLEAPGSLAAIEAHHLTRSLAEIKPEDLVSLSNSSEFKDFTLYAERHEPRLLHLLGTQYRVAGVTLPEDKHNSALDKELNRLAFEHYKMAHQATGPNGPLRAACEKTIINFVRGHPELVAHAKFTKRALECIQKSADDTLPASIPLFMQEEIQEIQRLSKEKRTVDTANACYAILQNRPPASEAHQLAQKLFKKLLDQNEPAAWYLKAISESDDQSQMEAFMTAEKFYAAQCEKKIQERPILLGTPNTLAALRHKAEILANSGNKHARAARSLYYYHCYAYGKQGRQENFKQAVYWAGAVHREAPELWPFKCSYGQLVYELVEFLTDMGEFSARDYLDIAADQGYSKALFERASMGLRNIQNGTTFRIDVGIVSDLTRAFLAKHEQAKDTLRKLCSDGHQGICLDPKMRDYIKKELDKDCWKILTFNNTQAESAEKIRQKGFYLYDQGNLPKAISTLEQAAQAGDAQAKIFLIDLELNHGNTGISDDKIVQMARSVLEACKEAVTAHQKNYLLALFSHKDFFNTRPALAYYACSISLSDPAICRNQQKAEHWATILEQLEKADTQSLIFCNGVIDRICQAPDDVVSVTAVTTLANRMIARIEQAIQENKLDALPLVEILKPFACIERVFARMLQNLAANSGQERCALPEHLENLQGAINKFGQSLPYLKLSNEQKQKLYPIERLSLLMMLNNLQVDQQEMALVRKRLGTLAKNYNDRAIGQYIKDDSKMSAYIQRALELKPVFLENRWSDCAKQVTMAIVQKRYKDAVDYFGENLAFAFQYPNLAINYQAIENKVKFGLLLHNLCEYSKELPMDSDQNKITYIQALILKASHDLALAKSAKLPAQKEAFTNRAMNGIKQIAKVDEFYGNYFLAHTFMSGILIEYDPIAVNQYFMKAILKGAPDEAAQKIVAKHVRFFLNNCVEPSESAFYKNLLEAAQKRLPDFSL